jgi:methionine-rich copper-binding protein CopC
MAPSPRRITDGRSTHRRSAHAVLTAIVTAVVLQVALAATAFAHAELVSAEPGPDAVVSSVPAELEARFSQDLDPSRGQIDVLDGDGDRLARGGPATGEVRTMTVALPPLENGRYTVRWTSYSAEDQELARGSYEFTVAVAATSSPTSSAAPASATPATGTASPGPTTSPSVTGSPTPAAPSATVAATASAPVAAPAPTGGTAAPTSDVSGPAVLIPIIVAVVVVAAIALRRSRPRRG